MVHAGGLPPVLPDEDRRRVTAYCMRYPKASLKRGAAVAEMARVFRISKRTVHRYIQRAEREESSGKDQHEGVAAEAGHVPGPVAGCGDNGDG